MDVVTLVFFLLARRLLLQCDSTGRVHAAPGGSLGKEARVLGAGLLGSAWALASEVVPGSCVWRFPCCRDMYLESRIGMYLPLSLIHWQYIKIRKFRIFSMYHKYRSM